MSRTIPIALYMNPDVSPRYANKAFQFEAAPGFHLVTGDARPDVLAAYDKISQHLTISVYEHPAIARAVMREMNQSGDSAEFASGRTVTGEGVMLAYHPESERLDVFDERENAPKDNDIVLSAWVSDAAEFEGLAGTTSAPAVAMSQWLAGLAAEISLDVVHHTQIALESVTGAYISPASISLQDLETNMSETFPAEHRDEIHNRILLACQDMETDSSVFPDNMDEMAHDVMRTEYPAP